MFQVYKRVLQGLVLSAGVLAPGMTTALQPGAQAPNLVVQDLYYEDATLAPSTDVRATVLFFFSNTCPVARRYMARVSTLSNEFRDRGVRFAGINASPADPVLDVAQHALEYQLTFPVYKDADFSAVKALHITRTPETVVLDEDFVVRYRGRVDDQYRLGGVLPEARNRDLLNALNQILAGEPVSVPNTQAEGCAVTFPMRPEPPDSLTYRHDIEPIFREHCLDCHGENLSAPFRLDSYDAVRKQKEPLLQVIRDRNMPPWFAAGEGVAPHVGLSPRERHRIANWLLGDADEGHSDSTQTGGPELTESHDLLSDGEFILDDTHPDYSCLVFAVDNPAVCWLQELTAIGQLPKGTTIAEVHLISDGKPEARELIAGPLVPGRSLKWGDAEGIRIPSRARIGLWMRGSKERSDPQLNPPIQLKLKTATAGIEQEVNCIKRVVATSEIGNGHVETVSLAPQRMLRAVALDLEKGFAATLDCRSAYSGEEQQVLSVPVFDANWPLTYALKESAVVGQGGGDLQWMVSPAAYLDYPSPDGQRGQQVQKPGENTLFIYIASATSSTP